MIEKIKEVYERINNEFLLQSPFGPFNDKKFRAEFKTRLENEIDNSVIKCDEENNPVDVIESCCLAVRVSWVENNEDKHCDLVFGQPERVSIKKDEINFKNDILSELITTENLYEKEDYDSMGTFSSHYMDVVESKEDIPDKEFPVKQFKLKVFTEFHETSEYRVSAKTTHEFEKDLKQYHDINIEDIVKDAFRYEAEISQQTQFIKKIDELAEKNINYSSWEKILSYLYRLFKKKYIKYTKCRDFQDLCSKIMKESHEIMQEGQRGIAKIIIVSNDILYKFFHSSDYFILKGSDKPMTRPGRLEKVGILVGMDVYLDHYSPKGIVYILRKNPLDEPGLVRVFSKKPRYETIYTSPNNILRLVPLADKQLLLITYMYLGTIGKRAHINYRKLNIR